jgi:WD40 repeat-containing protein SMU1
MNSSSLSADADSSASRSQFLTIPSAQVLRLIGAHLTESGLHATTALLKKESGVGLAGSPHSQWYQWACEGHWDRVLESLSRIDVQTKELVAQVYEMTILELAELGEWEVAYATYRLVQRDLDTVIQQGEWTLSRLLEQKLAALASLRQKDPKVPLPADYYGATTSRQEQREALGRQLQALIPEQPKNRLTSLLQQAVKWQSYTGKLPHTRHHEDGDDDDDDDDKKKKKKRKKRKVFDLVLGEVERDETIGSTKELTAEPIPSDPYSTVKFGKNATPESAAFLPDGSGLVTGSSDGLIEIWDAAQKYTQLRLDFDYQANDNLLGHDKVAVTALAVSRDGTLLASGDTDGYVNVWRLDTGKCLRRFQVASCVVTCLDFSPDGGRVLAAGRDGTCREFGLRMGRMLQEFKGHTSYVTSCSYQVVMDDAEDVLPPMLVVTGSGDGTVRLWNGKTSEVIRALRPSSDSSSIVVDPLQQAATDSPAVAVVLPLHTPPNTMILVPRCTEACLVNYQGIVLRRFVQDNTKEVFVAATVSSSNRALYAVREDGVCCVFDVSTGELTQTIRDFGSESTRRTKEDRPAEISAILYHPNKNIIASFSNDKGQKKGQLVLWK